MPRRRIDDADRFEAGSRVLPRAMSPRNRHSVPVLAVVVIGGGVIAYLLVQSYVLIETGGAGTTGIVRTAWFATLAVGIALLGIRAVLEK